VKAYGAGAQLFSKLDGGGEFGPSACGTERLTSTMAVEGLLGVTGPGRAVVPAICVGGPGRVGGGVERALGGGAWALPAGAAAPPGGRGGKPELPLLAHAVRIAQMQNALKIDRIGFPTTASHNGQIKIRCQVPKTRLMAATLAEACGRAYGRLVSSVVSLHAVVMLESAEALRQMRAGMRATRPARNRKGWS
jgi:hypothetical protein